MRGAPQCRDPSNWMLSCCQDLTLRSLGDLAAAMQHCSGFIVQIDLKRPLVANPPWQSTVTGRAWPAWPTSHGWLGLHTMQAGHKSLDLC